MSSSQGEWTHEVVCALLTNERLSSYLADTDGRLEAALELYSWNMKAAAAIMTTTGMVEIIVRNALDKQLTRWAQQQGGDAWFDAIPLDSQGSTDLAKARRRARRSGRDESHGKVVAELNFGFWRYLVARCYHTSLWVPALHAAFPHGDKDLRRRRERAERALASLMLVRNRAAHHEPIHRRNLWRDLNVANEVSSWIHPEGAAWVEYESPLPHILSEHPWPRSDAKR